VLLASIQVQKVQAMMFAGNVALGNTWIQRVAQKKKIVESVQLGSILIKLAVTKSQIASTVLQVSFLKISAQDLALRAEIVRLENTPRLKAMMKSRIVSCVPVVSTRRRWVHLMIPVRDVLRASMLLSSATMNQQIASIVSLESTPQTRVAAKICVWTVALASS
jgi:hypothetical protein